MISTSSILDRLQAVHKSGDGWTARCPAHEDKNPSLSVKEGDDGKILLHCHAGCTFDSIRIALQIEPQELFNDQAKAPTIKETYDYTDGRSKLLFQVVRYDPKGFRQRCPDGAGGWTWNLNGAPRVLYRLPEVLAAESVLVVEGEKDVERARSLGLVATCNAGGAGKWRDTHASEYSECLRGKRVAIIADADAAGRKHAQEVAASLYGKVKSLKVVELPGSKDLSEWTEAGGTREVLEGFLDLQPEWTRELSWRSMFHSLADFENALSLTFAVKNFLQNDAATLIGGLSGHGKTLVMLSLTKALLAGAGSKLWEFFDVLETAERVLYLIPESTITPFKHRLQLFGLYDSLRSDRLLVRTLSMGPTPCLSDPRILLAAKGAHVILDTAVRFSFEGDENSAGDNQRGLASDIFALLGAGARTVVGAHHSPKPFAKENVMRLENTLRGSGDIGAMVATAWGLKQLDPAQNIIHVENVKPRDFQPQGPFQIIGRPHINEEGDFRMHKRPGECGPLMDEQQPERANGGGAPVQAREARAANIELMKQWVEQDPKATSEEIAQRFEGLGISLSPVTVRKYRKELSR